MFKQVSSRVYHKFKKRPCHDPCLNVEIKPMLIRAELDDLKIALVLFHSKRPKDNFPFLKFVAATGY